MLKRGPTLEDVPLPRGAHPGRPVRHDDQEDALERLGRSLLAGDGATRRSSRSSRREPFDRPVQTTDLDEMKELVLVARRPAPRHPGAAGLGQDVDVGPPDRPPDRARQARRRRLDEPQGDPQPARRGRGAAGEIGLDFDGLKKASGGNPESYYDELEHIESVDRRGRRASAATSPPARRGSSRAPSTTARSTTSSSTRPARSRSPTRSRWARAARNVVLVGDPQQLAQVIQGTHPAGSGASVLRHLLGDDADDPARPRPLPRAHVPAAPGRLRLHLGGVLRGAARAGRRRRPTRTTPLGTGLRFLAVEHDGNRQESPEEVDARARARSSGCSRPASRPTRSWSSRRTTRR